MAAALPEQLLQLIVRFTTDAPDLSLTIPSPRSTTGLSLKRLIRTHLPASDASSRLRLIHAGRVLSDAASLSSSLNLPPPPPLNQGTRQGGDAKGKGKGKASARDTPDAQDAAAPATAPLRIYVHCSIGGALTAAELSAEAAAADAASASLASSSAPTSSAGRGGPDGTGQHAEGARSSGSAAAAAPPPPPLGFDRLLGSGFTQSEVAALRSQFLDILSLTHTPESMPGGHALRVLEDRWLDSDANGPGPDGAAGAAGGAAEEGWGAGFGSDDGGLDDMLWGNLVGFFWPLGALVWGFREEEVWTRRRQIAVVTGILVNLAFGFARLTG